MYIPTIGLEIHAELATRRKMFCDCLNDETELSPNVNVCPICLGHPGTLPVANERAIAYVVKTGSALNCRIGRFSKFDRKNYFYPDLPKAYQISQYDQPLCAEGFLTLPQSKKKIRITRIHLEEDTARLAHAADGKSSLVDFNRAGVPLMELVTEPDFHAAQDVVEFAREFQLILRYLGVSDGDMEKGHMRIEANISIARADANTLGTKVEVKNLNSFRAVEGAIAYEIARQEAVYVDGGVIKQETRGWNEATQETYSQRSKEEAHDYRYFPEPDLPPLTFDDAYLDTIRAQITELPQARRERFSQEYNLSETQADLLVGDMTMADFFEKTVSELRALDEYGDAGMVYNYLVSDIQGVLSATGMALSETKLQPEHLAHIVVFLGQNKISSRVAKDVLKKSMDTGRDPEGVLIEENLFQVSDVGALDAVVQEIIDKNEKVCFDYKNGKEAALQFLVGQVMAKTRGAANPEIVRTVLKGKLLI
ncbi:MAG: Asp-tRNA(Asn)/Glu-tRNA(Gln) amidotransferase subunit GatB [Candidatus Paceibacterota bacterium]|jgi:aspartyl-tRNA(Asn)/glutamyl-tRNA(Gln) amidotransferase subunit B